MELRPGYKQTEVGVIPEDWSVCRIDEVADVDPDNLGSNTNPDYPFKYISLEDVDTGVLKGVSEHTFRSAPSRARRKVKRGDVLVSTVRPNLMSHLLIKDDVLDLIASTGFSVVRCKPNLAASQFIYFNLFASIVGTQIETLVTGSNYPAINSQDVRTLNIPMPPLPEQRAIAAALSDVDALISALDKLIAKKRDLKQAAIQQLLTGKKRLPGFSGEWEAKKVSELGQVITGGTPPTKVKEYWEGEIPWVTPTDISSQKDIFVTERQLTTSGLETIRELPPDTVLVTCIASIGKNVILRSKGGCNQQINAIIPNEVHNADFLYYLFENAKQYLLGNAGITATSIISKGDFSEIHFCVPKLEEQTAIAAVLSDMDAEIAALEKRRDKSRALKQGMMQELLTGRTRLV